MTRFLVSACLGLLALGSFSGTASAQYYPPPGYPPPGYAPPPPPPPYYERPYYRPRREGFRCDATVRTPYGPRQLICEIIEPKPVGLPCACPPPPPPPGYPPGPYVRGHTIP